MENPGKDDLIAVLPEDLIDPEDLPESTEQNPPEETPPEETGDSDAPKDGEAPATEA